MAPIRSAEGLLILDPTVTMTLRQGSAGNSTSPVAEEPASGAAGLNTIYFVLNVGTISTTGGSAPSVTVIAFIQRTPDDGETWDDLLCITSAALQAGQNGIYVGEYSRGLGVAPPTPGPLQDASGSAAFAQRGNWVSNKLRVKWKTTVGGSPSSANATFTVMGYGRP